MTTLKSTVRTATAIIALVVLGACETTTNSAATQSSVRELTPVSAAQLLSSYKAANPGATSIPLLRGGRGFILNSDNTITYDDLFSKRELFRTTQVVSESGNSICMAPLKTWSGACLNLFQSADGQIRVNYKFGNGRGGSYRAR